MLRDIEKGLLQFINSEFPAECSRRSPLRLTSRIAGVVFTPGFFVPGYDFVGDAKRPQFIKGDSG